MINKVILVGRVGRDPEISYTANNTKLAKFSIATNESWKDKTTGEKKEITDWHNIVIFGNLAGICEQYVEKGMLIYIEGKLKTTSYEKEGIARYFTNVQADQMKMLGGGSRTAGTTQSPNNDQSPQDDDIPF